MNIYWEWSLPKTSNGSYIYSNTKEVEKTYQALYLHESDHWSIAARSQLELFNLQFPALAIQKHLAVLVNNELFLSLKLIFHRQSVGSLSLHYCHVLTLYSLVPPVQTITDNLPCQPFSFPLYSIGKMEVQFGHHLPKSCLCFVEKIPERMFFQSLQF